MQNPGEDFPRPNVPAVAIAPPPRCFHRGHHLAGPICGELASWMRPGNHWFSVEYFCDEHRGPSDVRIPAEHVFRRVRFNVDILFTGAHVNQPVCHTEALARLETAVKTAGGVLEVNAVTSHVVRSTALPPPRPAPGSAAREG